MDFWHHSGTLSFKECLIRACTLLCFIFCSCIFSLALTRQFFFNFAFKFASTASFFIIPLSVYIPIPHGYISEFPPSSYCIASRFQVFTLMFSNFFLKTRLKRSCPYMHFLCLPCRIFLWYSKALLFSLEDFCFGLDSRTGKVVTKDRLCGQSAFLSVWGKVSNYFPTERSNNNVVLAINSPFFLSCQSFWVF